MNQSGGSVNSNFNSGSFPQSGFNGGMNTNNNNGSGGFYPNQNGWRWCDNRWTSLLFIK